MAISDVKLPAGVNAHEYKSPVLLAEGLALNVAKQLSDALAARGNAVLVVSGGRSPVAFFQHLAKQELDWSKVVVTLADERWVPVEHADSNAGLLKQYLLKGPAAKAQFLSLYSAAANVEQAAENADRLLAELPAIDVLVLGMGDDGHTASLFPDSPNLAEALQADGTRRCWPMLAPSVPRQRLTMSRALLASAKHKILSISGQSKLTTLNAALASNDVAAMPVRAFLQPTLEIYWCP
ncbi:6-phosphogluconolactonase [Pseudomonas sp. UV AK001]|uniref:6-phosphogluconolactonase n=1 Tax=Pseudomonas sp. UV AK001 TaxID=3384791 RepID=UPI0038D5016D